MNGERQALIEAPSLEQTERLSALRLWHWQECLKASIQRDIWQRAKDVGAIFRVDKNLRLYSKRYNLHMGAVQMLNDFFPIGDTAERDAAK